MIMVIKEELEKRLEEIKVEQELIELKKKVDIEESKLAEEKSFVRKIFKKFFG